MSDDNVIPIRPARILAEAGGVVDRTHVTLGIHGEDLDPVEISSLLQCTPTSAHRRGDSRPRNQQPWPKGAWLLSVEGDAPSEPEDLLKVLLAQLPHDPSVWAELHRRFTVRLGFGLFLESWNRGFDLSPEVLQEVTRLGMSLGFDIYAGSDELNGRGDR